MNEDVIREPRRWTIRVCPRCARILPRTEVCPRHPRSVPAEPVEVVEASGCGGGEPTPAIRDEAELLIQSLLELLPVEGSASSGYAVREQVVRQVNALPEEWATAAHHLVELDGLLRLPSPPGPVRVTGAQVKAGGDAIVAFFGSCFEDEEGCDHDTLAECQARRGGDKLAHTALEAAAQVEEETHDRSR